MNKKEEQVEIKGKVLLKGTLSIPETTEEKAPAVLIIAGSGPGNRDGNIPKAKLNLNMYKMFADQFTDVGFISLRYDKRGVGESEGDLDRAGMWDLVDDAESALQFLKSHENVDHNRIVVLGHSEGCMLATALNEREKVSGLILLAGAAETIEEATKRQRELAYKEINSKKGFQGWLIKKLKVTEKAEKNTKKMFDKIVASDKDTIRVQIIAKMPAKWFREHFKYDLFGAMEKITCPVLAITGSKDIQATPEKVYDVPKLVKGPTEVHVIDGMSHVLREQKGDISITKIKKAYQDQSRLPLHPELIEKIITWLKNEFTK